MKMEDIEPQVTSDEPVSKEEAHAALAPPFSRIGLETMDAFHEGLLDLGDSLLDIESFGGPEAKKKAQKLIHAVKEFEPSITMIGQIKSGKTSLVNAIAGRPDLLPADVGRLFPVLRSARVGPPC